VATSQPMMPLDVPQRAAAVHTRPLARPHMTPMAMGMTPAPMKIPMDS